MIRLIQPRQLFPMLSLTAEEIGTDAPGITCKFSGKAMGPEELATLADREPCKLIHGELALCFKGNRANGSGCLQAAHTIRDAACQNRDNYLILLAPAVGIEPTTN